MRGIVLILALLSPLVAAQSGPAVVIVEDARGDIAFGPWSQPWIAPAREMDLTRMVFTVTDDTLYVRFEVLNLSYRTPGMTRPAFYFQARDVNQTWVHLETWEVPPSWAIPDTHKALFKGRETPVTWDYQNNTITVSIPRALVAGGLTDGFAWSYVTLQTVSLANRVVRDYAPDGGHERPMRERIPT